jgi:hypothetical protein
MIYTGYIDSEREPIKTGDYMASPTELFVGMVMETKHGFVLSYGNTFDELRRLNNEYHIVSEDYATYLYNRNNSW